MTLSKEASIESNVKSYCRSIPCVLSKAIGSEVWDVDNQRYLDFLAGAGSLNYGHNNPTTERSAAAVRRAELNNP